MSISKKTKTIARNQALDLEHYVPHFLSTISNRWMSSSSRLYLKRFGIGVVEWRVLGYLGSSDKPGTATSLDIATAICVDPAAVSRAMKILARKSLVEPQKGRFAGNAKPFVMTPTGVNLFEEIREIALEREGILLQDLSPNERSLLISLLRKLFDRLDELGGK